MSGKIKKERNKKKAKSSDQCMTYTHAQTHKQTQTKHRASIGKITINYFRENAHTQMDNMVTLHDTHHNTCEGRPTIDIDRNQTSKNNMHDEN